MMTAARQNTTAAKPKSNRLPDPLDPRALTDDQLRYIASLYVIFECDSSPNHILQRLQEVFRDYIEGESPEYLPTTFDELCEQLINHIRFLIRLHPDDQLDIAAHIGLLAYCDILPTVHVKDRYELYDLKPPTA